MDDYILCAFCGNTISNQYPYFTYKNQNQEVKVAHYDCMGVEQFVQAWGLALRLNEIAFSGGYGD